MRTTRLPSADDSSAVLQTYGPRSADGSSALPDISSTIDRHKYRTGTYGTEEVRYFRRTRVQGVQGVPVTCQFH
jgi:hypothetical protein